MTRAAHISQRLKLQQLNVLLAVAKAGSMAKAAKQLAMSQPVVSRAVADLETTFGVRLFDRSPQGVEPTLYGRALLKRSVAILDDLAVSASEIEHLVDPTAGELRIGCTEPQAVGAVGAAIEELTLQHPRIAFKIEQADEPTLINRYLRERRVDLLVTPLQNSSLDEDLDATVLYYNRLRLVVGRQSRWAHHRKIALSDLIDEPWVAPPSEDPTGSLLAEAFRVSGLSLPRLNVATVACQLCTKLVTGGQFIGLSSDGFQYFNAKRVLVKVLPIELPVEPFPIAIVTLKN